MHIHIRKHQPFSLEEAWEVKEVREKEILLFSTQETENQAKYR
jgi:hypothetical protein